MNPYEVKEVATCVVLGAGAGVGQAVARAFLGRGYHVALCARNREKLDALSAELGENASAWHLDVSNLDELKVCLAEIAEKHGDIEVLHFNAFSLTPGRGSRIDPEKFSYSLAVNVTPALTASQAVIPAMKGLGKGTILFTGGGYAIQPAANVTALSVGKAALRALNQCLHEELTSSGIHVATVTICGIVAPGTAFDPSVIAESFLQLHDQPAGAFDAEIVFNPVAVPV